MSDQLRKRFLDQVIISMYVLPLERVHPSLDMEAPDLEDVMKITPPLEPPKSGGILGDAHARHVSKLL